MLEASFNNLKSLPGRANAISGGIIPLDETNEIIDHQNISSFSILRHPRPKIICLGFFSLFLIIYSSSVVLITPLLKSEIQYPPITQSLDVRKTNKKRLNAAKYLCINSPVKILTNARWGVTKRVTKVLGHICICGALFESYTLKASPPRDDWRSLINLKLFNRLSRIRVQWPKVVETQ